MLMLMNCYVNYSKFAFNVTGGRKGPKEPYTNETYVKCALISTEVQQKNKH